MRVQEIMTKNPICCIPEDSVQDAAYLMRTHNIGALPVVRGQTTRKLLGIVTDRDLCLTVLPKNLRAHTLTVASTMTRRPVTCKPGDRIEDCAALMQTYEVRRIPVIDDNDACVGIVSLVDLAAHIPADMARQTARRASHHEPVAANVV